MCLAKDFYDFQWYEEFSTENVIRCPECDLEVSDRDWGAITDTLCESHVLQRNIVYDTYFCPSLYNKYRGNIELGRQYTSSQIEKIGINFRHYNQPPDLVYFKKFNSITNFRMIYYRFFYGTPEVRNLFPSIEKQLIEYIFHPTRMNPELIELL